MNEARTTTTEKVRFFCQIAEEKKVSDIVVLFVGPLTPIADYFVIGTCENAIEKGFGTFGEEDRNSLIPLGHFGCR
ncbi:MAG: RsfS/YbeB/iojap family protein [Armatimonadota bacterium]|nr:RsfS/YbeB/iojap family protein [Armatimonadota bacterium]